MSESEHSALDPRASSQEQSATPTRPPRPTRSSTYDTPNTSFNSVSRRRFDLEDTDQTPRKAKAQAQAFGLPTPPNSETTSSAGDSTGRARKDSDQSLVDQRLVPPSDQTVMRSPSVSSSCTGSDTVGARSPIDRQGGFLSPSLDSPSDGGSRYSTVGRRRGTELASASNLDTPQRTSNRSVQRATSSLGFRSAFANEAGRSTPLSLSRTSGAAGQDAAGRETPDRAERRKRSAIHEQEVTQLRSESRLGRGEDQEDEANTTITNTNTTATGTVQHKYSPRKSTALARTRYNASEDSVEDTATEEGGSKQSPTTSFRSLSRASVARRGEESGPSGASRDYGVSRRTVNSYMQTDEGLPPLKNRKNSKTLGSSPLSETVPLEVPTQSRSGTNRSPLPLEFRLLDRETRKAWRAAHARDQSDSAASDGSDGEPQEKNSAIASSGGRTRRSTDKETVRSPVKSNGHLPAERSSYRRGRYSSDAQADEVPALEYEGRLGTQGSRISVDSSSANRYLTKGPLQGTPMSARRGSRASEIGSPSEEARARKISTSSSRSQKSSGGASDLHRTASRASMRRAFGRDVFDDEGLPPLPGSRSESPSMRSDPHQYGERLRSLRECYRELKAGNTGRQGWANELDDLRHRIEELTVASSARSPSVNSYRTHSALGIHRTPTIITDSSRMQRGSVTEPRQRQERSSTFSEIGSGDGESEGHRSLRSYSRAGGAYLRGATPMTPDAHSTQRLATASRASVIQLATLPSTARFPSGGYSVNGNRVKSEGSVDVSPVHDRNMHNAFDMFERYFSTAPSSLPGTPIAAGPEPLEMVASLKQVISTASELNSGLRVLIQTNLEAQIDAEVNAGRGDASAATAAEVFAHLDHGLTEMLKRSDEQVRNLTDGLMSITRAERERDRQRKAEIRPTSRMSAAASPVEDMRRSLDGRNVRLRESASPAETIVEQGNGEPRIRTSERFLKSMRAPASPFSPLHSKGSVGGTLTASQIRSMSSIGHHARSASEMSPGSGLRRKKSTTLNATVKPLLSPRRPKLSFPSVSNATASFAPATAPEGQVSETKDRAEGVLFPTADESAAESLSRACRFVSEPFALDEVPRRNTVIGSPESADRRTSPISKRHSVSVLRRNNPPPRPPRHDLMQRDADERLVL